MYIRPSVLCGRHRSDALNKPSWRPLLHLFDTCTKLTRQRNCFTHSTAPHLERASSTIGVGRTVLLNSHHHMVAACIPRESVGMFVLTQLSTPTPNRHGAMGINPHNNAVHYCTVRCECSTSCRLASLS
jgi:hypothetical protein